MQEKNKVDLAYEKRNPVKTAYMVRFSVLTLKRKSNIISFGCKK